MENNHGRVGIITAIIIAVAVLAIGGYMWKEKRDAAEIAATYQELLAKENAQSQAKQDESDWQIFTPESGNFIVSFPGVPEVKTQSMVLPDNAGEAIFTSYEAVDVDNAMYGVYEISGISFTGSQADLENALNNYISGNNKYTLVSSAPTTFLGHKALDFLIQVQGNYYLKGMYIAASDRLYQINSLYDKTVSDDAAFSGFISSFKAR